MIPSTYTSAEHISLCQNEVVACPQKFEPGRQRIPHPRPLIVWKEGEEGLYGILWQTYLHFTLIMQKI